MSNLNDENDVEMQSNSTFTDVNETTENSVTSNDEENIKNELNQSSNSDNQPVTAAENVEPMQEPIQKTDSQPSRFITNKKVIVIAGLVIAGAILVLILGIGAISSLNNKHSELQAKYEKLNSEYEELNSSYTQVKKEKETLQAEYDEVVNGASAQLTEIKNAFEAGEWQTVIDKTSALHEKYNGSNEDIEAQELAATSKAKLEEAAAAKAAEEAKGFETGITYDQLARTPDDFKGQKVKFSGKVLQVVEDSGYNVIRLAVNSDYDKVILCVYSPQITSGRILEDDIITIYGTSEGTTSYQSTLGGTITIPSVTISKVDQ